MAIHQVTVTGIPAWVPAERLLGPDWTPTETSWNKALERSDASDVLARLRNVSIGGSLVQTTVYPKLKRNAIRQGRLLEARRLRDTSTGFRKSGARLDDEARFSLTPEDLALALGQRLAPGSVVDACCGAGGNTIGFARAGCEVTAIELSASRLGMAKHNVRLYGVQRQVQFQLGDGLELLSQSQADYLFIDPPWGDWDRQRCGLSDFPLLRDAVGTEGLATRYKALWAKVPSSFDPGTLSGATAEAIFGVGVGDRHRIKYLLLRLKLA
jgi:SAM-dependent methyltransferase